VEQNSEPVVLEAGEATSGTLDLLHAEIEAFGRTVSIAGVALRVEP
jgi:hypothetical protein